MIRSITEHVGSVPGINGEPVEGGRVGIASFEWHKLTLSRATPSQRKRTCVEGAYEDIEWASIWRGDR